MFSVVSLVTVVAFASFSLLEDPHLNLFYGVPKVTGECYGVGRR